MECLWKGLIDKDLSLNFFTGHEKMIRKEIFLGLLFNGLFIDITVFL